MCIGKVSLCGDKQNIVDFLLSQKFEWYDYNNRDNSSSSHLLIIYSVPRTLSSLLHLILTTVQVGILFFYKWEKHALRKLITFPKVV